MSTSNNTSRRKTPMQEALKYYMQFKGVSGSGFARGLGIDKTAVSRFLNGKPVKLETYNKILTWFITVPTYPGDSDE